MTMPAVDRKPMVIPACRACGKKMPVSVPQGTVVVVCCPRCKMRAAVVA